MTPLKTACVVLAICVTAVAVRAAVDSPLEITERARGANKVVLATVTDVEAELGENEFGDQLILSSVTMQVDETLKGTHESTVVVTLEGGTVGDLTLEVSDMPILSRGQRAVVFLASTPSGKYLPHGRGAGVLRLNAGNHAPDANLTLDDIRAAVKAAQARNGR